MRFYLERRPKSWRGKPGGGGTRAWGKQRARILKCDGHRCTAIENGVRCLITAPAPLEVHHLRQGYGIDAADQDLVTVCRRHHLRGAV